MRAEPEHAADRRSAGQRRHREAGLPGPGLQEGLNPYAPPKASVELAPQSGLWRSGRLVRMDRAGALPDRCVICNAPAENRRVKRTLYWTPKAWRIGTAAVVVGFAAIGAALVPYVLLAFWPLVLVLIIANLFIRKSLKLELGICAHHRRLRTILIALSWACIAGVFAGIFSTIVMLASIAALLALIIVQSLVGVQTIRLKELSLQHAWLSGTGEAFRGALPELN